MLDRQRRPPQVLVIGLGGLGGWVLELLARAGGVSSIVAADINEEWGRRKVYNVAAGAMLQGHYPHIEFAAMDLRNLDGSAETIAVLQPELIINCATLQTWWVRKILPPETTARLNKAGSGPWLPTHLALSRKLMLAIRESGLRCHVINSGIPDISNTVLAKRGLAPTVGLGNIDLLIPVLRMGAAERLSVPARNVHVYAVFHHYHVSHFRKHSSGAPPYFLRLMVGDTDVTGRFDTDLLLHEVSAQRFSGEPLNPVVAASGVKNGLALLHDSGLLTHAAGPQGLPGGYPVRISGDGAAVVLPAGVTMEQALAINEGGQRYDGIERIDDDGTVHHTAQAVQIMKELLGYDLAPLVFDECDERARELVARFKALAGAQEQA